MPGQRERQKGAKVNDRSERAQPEKEKQARCRIVVELSGTNGCSNRSQDMKNEEKDKPGPPNVRLLNAHHFH